MKLQFGKCQIKIVHTGSTNKYILCIDSSGSSTPLTASLYLSSAYRKCGRDNRIGAPEKIIAYIFQK